VSNRGEQQLLKQSTVLMFAVAIAGIVTGFVSGSQSILFDGFFSLIATFIKVLMLITAQLIAKESNQRFQFGFWHLEPMVLLIEGSFLLLIAIYAFLNGVFGIINGGRDIELGLVIVYAGVFTVVEFGYYFWIRHKNRTLKSTLIQFDNISWLVDAMLSAGLLISFVTALVLKQQGYAQWAAYWASPRTRWMTKYVMCSKPSRRGMVLKATKPMCKSTGGRVLSRSTLCCRRVIHWPVCRPWMHCVKKSRACWARLTVHAG
jgi:predicted Co/Zn/Cd cation transporter (cation efflux family)